MSYGEPSAIDLANRLSSLADIVYDDVADGESVGQVARDLQKVVNCAHALAKMGNTRLSCPECAKLRELCVKALEWLRWAGGITCPPEVPDEFADELRELGIEVDG